MIFLHNYMPLSIHMEWCGTDQLQSTLVPGILLANVRSDASPGASPAAAIPKCVIITKTTSRFHLRYVFILCILGM